MSNASPTVDKQFIVKHIQRLAAELGSPPGRKVFEDEVGIRTSEWHGRVYRSWGDALIDAGFEPRVKQERLPSELLLQKFSVLVRELQRIPAAIDMRMYSRRTSGFPGMNTFQNHFGGKKGLISAFSAYIRQSSENADLIKFLPEQASDRSEAQGATKDSHVYLLRSGDFFKIGRSKNLEQRVKQVSVALPDALTLEHSMKTDDAPGIEAYWHKRFADKRANGEWFKLLPADVRAFKRRRFM